MNSDMIDIGNRNQVFLDGRLIEETTNVSIIAQKPRKTGEKNIVSDVYTYARRGSSPNAILVSPQRTMENRLFLRLGVDTEWQYS